ncbi:serpin, putative, partial [Ixodes scapularis]
TNKKITHILDADALDQNTVMLAINVIRFKGLWSSKFEQRLNSIDTFHNADETAVPTTFMFKSGFLQVSKLQVDEAGSEAESMTVVKVSGKSAETAATVTVDHPFLFFITAGADDVVLFAGQVNHIEKA